MNRVYTGTVEGTGAEIEIETGFIPAYVRLFNADGVAILDWTDKMADGFGIKTADSGTGTTDISYITTGGVTPSDEDDDFSGFKIGTDSDVNVDGETLFWVAFPDRQ